MKNRFFLLFLGLIIIAGGALSIRTLTGDEDGWICEEGTWIMHGNPATQKPSEGCGENAVNKDSMDPDNELTVDQDATLGGDRDEHGCIGSAGYTWCEGKNKCLRAWEESCDEEASSDDDVTKAVRDQMVDKYGSDASGMVITLTTAEGGYAKGMANDPQGGGGMWFAAKAGGVWKLVWDGNGIITCADIEGYDFPAVMIPECYDTAKDTSVSR